MVIFVIPSTFVAVSWCLLCSAQWWGTCRRVAIAGAFVDRRFVRRFRLLIIVAYLDRRAFPALYDSGHGCVRVSEVVGVQM